MDFCPPGLGPITVFQQTYNPNRSLLPPGSLNGNIGNTAPVRSIRRPRPTPGVVQRPLSQGRGATNDWRKRDPSVQKQHIAWTSSASSIGPERTTPTPPVSRAASSGELTTITPYEHGHVNHSTWILNNKCKRRAPVQTSAVSPEEDAKRKEHAMAKLWNPNKNYGIKAPPWWSKSHPYWAEREKDPTRGNDESTRTGYRMKTADSPRGGRRFDSRTTNNDVYSSKPTKLKCHPDGTPALHRQQEAAAWHLKVNLSQPKPESYHLGQPLPYKPLI